MKLMPELIVKKSKFGKGVFAGRDFKKGKHICFLKGKIMGLKAFYYLDKLKRGSMDPLQVNENKYIVLDKPYLLINHSCNPNAGIKGKNELFALKNIKKDEEIFYDYSTTMEESFECKCGSKNCRKKITNFSSLPKRIQKRYIQKGAITSHIMKNL
ncbi:MAG: SET domain-containing protein-lysine N-methyltransferase [Nanoarchaeota archaeon]